ncbi:MAG: monooxygenase [Actinobacteria bacterium]|nr:monooxygenase [Actinomycetota bacterium]
MIVRLDVWGIRKSGVPGAFLRMATQRRVIRRIPGVQFAKLMGTGSGETFTMRDSDLTHWAILTVWSDDSGAEGFDDHPRACAWQDSCTEHACITMRPLVSRGSWSGHEPFAVPDTKAGPGPIAAITRARIKPHLWWRFWSSVPPVALDLRSDPGVLFTLGIGEAPVGLQGTFSIWRDAAALSEFAYRRPAHAEVVTRTHEVQWYAEEMFTRFQVLSVQGRYDGRDVLPAN